MNDLKTTQTIQIVRPKMLKASYELQLNSKIIGTIIFPKAMGTLAEVRLFEEEWTFKRTGFWKPLISVRKKGEDKDFILVSFSGGWNRGISFTTADGILYEMVSKGFWNPKWYWMRHDRQLIEYDVRFGAKKYADARIIYKDELTPLMLLVGSYAIIMMGMEDSTSTAAITAAIA
jgi:hypothetical protein